MTDIDVTNAVGSVTASTDIIFSKELNQGTLVTPLLQMPSAWCPFQQAGPATTAGATAVIFNPISEMGMPDAQLSTDQTTVSFSPGVYVITANQTLRFAATTTASCYAANVTLYYTDLTTGVLAELVRSWPGALIAPTPNTTFVTCTNSLTEYFTSPVPFSITVALNLPSALPAGFTMYVMDDGDTATQSPSGILMQRIYAFPLGTNSEGVVTTRLPISYYNLCSEPGRPSRRSAMRVSSKAPLAAPIDRYQPRLSDINWLLAHPEHIPEAVPLDTIRNLLSILLELPELPSDCEKAIAFITAFSNLVGMMKGEHRTPSGRLRFSYLDKWTSRSISLKGL